MTDATLAALHKELQTARALRNEMTPALAKTLGDVELDAARRVLAASDPTSVVEEWRKYRAVQDVLTTMEDRIKGIDYVERQIAKRD